MNPALIVLAIAALAAAVWASLRWLTRWRDSFERRVEEKLEEEQERWRQSLLERFDKLQERLDESKRFMTGRVDRAEYAVRQVTQQLGKLENAAAQLLKTNVQILDFQKMLRSPQVRGGFGEVLLHRILEEVLPAAHYALQYTFRSGEVADAVVKLPDGHIVAVDAKFPLANFERMRAARDEEGKRRWESVFVQDVKARVREIGRKYISASDRTLDFAFMYLPLESVFQAILARRGLYEFCLQQHVYPVSPNSLVPYLQTILVGLRGMQLEKRTKEILRELGRLRTEAVRLQESFEVLGKHLGNARTKYEEADRRLGKLADRMERLELPAGEPAALPKGREEAGGGSTAPPEEEKGGSLFR